MEHSQQVRRIRFKTRRAVEDIFKRKHLSHPSLLSGEDSAGLLGSRPCHYDAYRLPLLLGQADLPRRCYWIHRAITKMIERETTGSTTACETPCP